MLVILLFCFPRCSDSLSVVKHAGVALLCVTCNIHTLTFTRCCQFNNLSNDDHDCTADAGEQANATGSTVFKREGTWCTSG